MDLSHAKRLAQKVSLEEFTERCQPTLGASGPIIAKAAPIKLFIREYGIKKFWEEARI